MQSNIYERKQFQLQVKLPNNFWYLCKNCASSPKVLLSFSSEQNVKIFFDAIGLFLQFPVSHRVEVCEREITICIIYNLHNLLRQITRQGTEIRQSVEEHFLPGINYFANWVQVRDRSLFIALGGAEG